MWRNACVSVDDVTFDAASARSASLRQRCVCYDVSVAWCAWVMWSYVRPRSLTLGYIMSSLWRHRGDDVDDNDKTRWRLYRWWRAQQQHNNNNLTTTTTTTTWQWLQRRWRGRQRHNDDDMTTTMMMWMTRQQRHDDDTTTTTMTTTTAW